MDDGIYFGLSDDDYHADPALGSSSLKQLTLDPVDWQYERLFGEDNETEALIWGRALHARVLEGRTAFEAKFCTEFETPEGDCLKTVDDLKGWLKEAGHSHKGNKAELVARILGTGAAPQIYDQMKSAHDSSNEGKTPLTAKQYAQIETAAQWMQSDATLSASMKDGSFQHGAPEVSVFYTEDGVRLKARFDYLIGHAIIDLKSFAPMYREVPASSITRAIIRQRYDLQCAAYVKAWHVGRGLWKDGRVYGEAPEGLLEKVYANGNPLWIWVFLKSTSAPQPYVRSLSSQEMVFGTAQHAINRAIEIYKEKVEAHGADNIWPPMNPPDALATDDFPAWFQN